VPHHPKPAVLRETVAYIMGKHSVSAARSRSLQCSSSSARELDAEPMHWLQSNGCSGLGRAVACRYQLFGTVEHPSSLDCGCRRPCGGGVHSHERHKVQAQSLWLGLHTHTTRARTDERTHARTHARACVHVSMHGACSRGTKHSTRSLAGRVDENDLGAPSRSFSPSACTTTTKALRWKRHRGRSAGPPYAGAAAEETVETARSRISSASMAEYGGRVHGIKSVGVLGTDVGLPLSCRFAI
jgi:hypothetical protein